VCFDCLSWDLCTSKDPHSDVAFARRYYNNRSVSFARNGTLHILPQLLADMIGDANVQTGTMDVWGGDPASVCTGNFDYGCLRTGGAGGNIVNPVMSARLRTAETFAFKYGRVEVVAALPRGDWLWPAIWLLPVRQDYGACSCTSEQARPRHSGVEARERHCGVSRNGVGVANVAVAHLTIQPRHPHPLLRRESAGNWPVSGEIDIMESRGNARGYPAGGVSAHGGSPNRLLSGSPSTC